MRCKIGERATRFERESRIQQLLRSRAFRFNRESIDRFDFPWYALSLGKGINIIISWMTSDDTRQLAPTCRRVRRMTISFSFFPGRRIHTRRPQFCQNCDDPSPPPPLFSPNPRAFSPRKSTTRHRRLTTDRLCATWARSIKSPAA